MVDAENHVVFYSQCVLCAKTYGLAISLLPVDSVDLQECPFVSKKKVKPHLSTKSAAVRGTGKVTDRRFAH